MRKLLLIVLFSLPILCYAQTIPVVDNWNLSKSQVDSIMIEKGFSPQPFRITAEGSIALYTGITYIVNIPFTMVGYIWKIEDFDRNRVEGILLVRDIGPWDSPTIDALQSHFTLQYGNPVITEGKSIWKSAGKDAVIMENRGRQLSVLMKNPSL